MPRVKLLAEKPNFSAVVGWNLCLFALVLALPEPFAYGQVKLYEGRELIAALELQSFTQQLTSEQVQYLTDAVRKALADAIDPQRYTVMTRESMDVLIPPEERKCLNDACYAVVGKRLQARLLLAGNVKDLGKRIGVTLEAYDGPTGAVLGIEQGEGQDIDELLEKVRAMARQIVAKVLGTKIPLKPVSPGIPEPLPPSFEEKVTPPKPEEGYLSVEGTPKGAVVLITGAGGSMSLRLPTGPLRVKAGEYSIKVTARDFDEFKEDVFVPADQTKVVTVNLVPSYGQLDIKGTPEGAKTEVSCEKNYKKEVGLPSKLVVPHGMCKIKVTRTGYEPFEREVIVEGGKTMEVKVNLVLESQNVAVGWQDNFETYAPNLWPSENWIKDANGGGVDDTVHHEGTKSLKITGVIGSCWAGLGYRALSVTPPFYIEMWVKNGTEALSGCHAYRSYIGLRKGTSWRNPGRQLILFDQSSKVRGTSDSQIAKYTPGIWYKIKIKYERPTPSTVKITYWINDTYITEETVSAVSDEDFLNNLDLTCGEGSCWFDEVKVYSAR